MQSRIPVRELAQAPDPSSIRVAGRVVAITSGGFVLQDDTGCVTVQLDPPPPLGAFVQLSATRSADGLVQARDFETVTAGGQRFTRSDSDWSWLVGSRMSHLRRRHELKRAVRRFLDAQGLLEVDTPAIVPCPGLDVHLDAIEVLGMRGSRWLHTSPEYQMKRLLTSGVPGIYQLGKAFRRGERGRLHEPEFCLLEWYRTFADESDVMRDTEQLVARVASELLGSTTLPGIEGAVDVAPPWERITVAEAFARFAELSLAEALRDEEVYFQVMAEQIEPNLGRGRPVFLTQYPAAMASLAKLSDTDPHVAERFEAYLDGVELCNGFSELNDPAEQLARLKRDQELREKSGRSVYPIDERFIAALEEGVPPSGGNALGFDRLLMLMVGARHIEEVTALPVCRI